MTQPNDCSFWNSLCDTFLKNNQIPYEKYSAYGIKRGLRNADGTGVLAGITRISNVHGYLLNEGERQPVEGKLTYRGIDLFDLLDGITTEHRFGYCETAHLLLCGALPTQTELQHFGDVLAASRQLPPQFTEDVLMRVPNADIMNKLAYATLALYAYDKNADDTSIENVLKQGVSLISRFPVIISHAYQAKRRYIDHASMYLHEPDSTLSTAENILRLIRADGTYTMQEAYVLDRCLMIHAEHGGGNNSAFATRVASSSGTDTYSAIATAVGALKGPRHGGANHKVVEMFALLQSSVSDIQDEDAILQYLIRLLQKQAGDQSGLIYGMGHAVYTLSDPRAVALKQVARPLAQEKGLLPEFHLIEAVERLTPVALSRVRPGFEKPICANVDLYSGFVYRMLGIPQELYTPLFAVARVIGWMAHRLEEVATGGRIIRPAYKPLPTQRATYIPLNER